MQSLTQGYYDGIIKVSELKERGNIGIGTFEGVHGEMIILDGECYQAKDDRSTVPFNIRYCSRKYGYDRKRLSDNLPILAQTNLDGNCFLMRGHMKYLNASKGLQTILIAECIVNRK